MYKYKFSRSLLLCGILLAASTAFADSTEGVESQVTAQGTMVMTASPECTKLLDTALEHKYKAGQYLGQAEAGLNSLANATTAGYWNHKSSSAEEKLISTCLK